MSFISGQFGRYIINGLGATLIHYSSLLLIKETLDWSSAGSANFVASVIGISASYLGNKYFVFSQSDARVMIQGAKSLLIYIILATCHGVILFIWTDKLGLDYRVGFFFGVIFQFLVSYTINKYYVFKSEHQ
jgi:putative flippase GtrA